MQGFLGLSRPVSYKVGINEPKETRGRSKMVSGNISTEASGEYRTAVSLLIATLSSTLFAARVHQIGDQSEVGPLWETL